VENKPFSYEDFFKQAKFGDKQKAIVQTIVLALILVIVTSIGVLSIDIYLVALLLIFLPALFSTIFCLSLAQSKRDYTNKEFLRGFQTYYSSRSPFFGCFDVIKGLLLSILVSMACSFIFTLIYPNFLGEEFNEAVEEMLMYFENQDMDGLALLLEENEILGNFYALSTLISLGSATIFMILRTGKFIFNTETRMLTSMFGPKKATLVFKVTWKENRKEFLSDFIKYNWYIILLIILAFIGAILGMIYLGYSSYSYLVATSTAILVGICFLPKYLIFIEAITEKNILKFKSSFKRMVDETLNSLNMNNSLNQAEKQRIENAMKLFDSVTQAPPEENNPNEEAEEPKDKEE